MILDRFKELFTMKYAIIKSGGKQYRVAQDDIIDVELLGAEEGADIEFQDILFMHDGNEPSIGGPLVSNGLVTGQVLGEVKGDKIYSIKYKRSHNEVRKFGHRQRYQRVKITGISLKKGKEKKHGS
jgi:large subunit ribosomal protein L21